MVKQDIAPLQAYQVDLIEKRNILFDIRAMAFRNKFLDETVRLKFSFLKKGFAKSQWFLQSLEIINVLNNLWFKSYIIVKN